MSESIITQRPAKPTELLLLFHGVGAQPASLVPLAESIGAARPRAFVVSVQAAWPSDMGHGRQWFSVRGVTEENRPDRVAQAMPAFADAVRHWQQETGVAPEATAIIGFSQGSIMGLESLKLTTPLARCLVAIAGRFATLPEHIASGVEVKLIHGSHDPVIAPRHAVDARTKLQLLGVPVTLDLVEGLGHSIDERVAAHAVARLSEVWG